MSPRADVSRRIFLASAASLTMAAVARAAGDAVRGARPGTPVFVGTQREHRAALEGAGLLDRPATTVDNTARLSAAGIPVISVVHGSSTAGGAYIPALSDEVIMVRGNARIHLGGPSIVKIAINGDGTAGAATNFVGPNCTALGGINWDRGAPCRSMNVLPPCAFGAALTMAPPIPSTSAPPAPNTRDRSPVGE